MVFKAATVPISPLTVAYIRSIAALSIVVLSLVFALPVFRPIKRVVGSLISDIAPIESLLPADPPSRDEVQAIRKRHIRVWRQILLVGLAAVAMALWMGVTASVFIQAIHRQAKVLDVLSSAAMVVVWFYLAASPVIRPPSTPSWTCVLLYLVVIFNACVNLGMTAFLAYANRTSPPWASPIWLALEIANLAVALILMLVMAGLPLASPEALARLPSIAPDDEVTLASWISFSWVDSFIRFGNSKELEPEDLPPMSMSQQTAIIFDRFRQVKRSTLLRKLLWANRLDIGVDFIFTMLSVIFNYASPFFLKQILDGISHPSRERLSLAYVYAILAVLASCLKALSDLLHLWHGRRASVRIKAQLIAAIYDKALKRKDASGVITKDDEEKGATGKEEPGKPAKEEKRSNADSGKVVNLMSGDTNRIANTIVALYFLYGSPMEIIVASVFLYKILGWSAFAGIVVLAVAAPLNSVLSKRSIKIQQDLMNARDKRISVMNELIPAIQFIKFFAWTEQWKTRAKDARAGEMKEMVKSLFNSIYFAALWNIAPILVTLVSFFCYIVIAKRELTVSVAFTAISLFQMLRMPLNVIPTFIVFILQSLVSVKRIEDFLGEDEVPEWVSSLKRTGERLTVKTKIGFEHASYRWNTGKVSGEATDSSKVTLPAPAVPAIVVAPSDSESSGGSPDGTAVDADPAEQYFRLSDLHVEFPLGKLTVISGPTGSGKTAVLTALLGEMELLEGKGHLPKYTTEVDKKTGLRNSVAYAAQTPWLQQKSIKDNILFGEELDEKRYQETIEACALVPDFDMLEDGDSTEIGQKGISLSGGQKARVALARAVYSYTQHVLLDDPLAAVDSHTAKHLTDKCLNGPILKGRTVILVSHHMELLLPSADYIVRILEGRIDAHGTPQDLRNRGELDGLVAMEESEIKAEEPVVASKDVNGDVEVETDVQNGKKDKKPARKFVQDEERQIGNVKWETYKLYIVAATWITWLCSLIILVISQLFTIGERYWLKVWGEAYTTSLQSVFAFVQPQLDHQATAYHHTDLNQAFMHFTTQPVSNMTAPIAARAINFPSADTHPDFYLSGYAVIVLGAALLAVISSAAGSWGQYRAAVNIHNRLLDTMMLGSIRFFNITPTGRIINRFSRDIETIDSSLNYGLRAVIGYVANLLGAIVTVGIIVPWFLIPAAIISWLYWQYTVLYLRIGRSLRRLEATSRSPIFSGFAELLDGVVSVRAFSVEKRFMKQLCEQVDKTDSAHYYYWMMNRWLLLRFDILGALSVFFTTLFALSGAVKAGSAGMAILSAQSFVSACYWLSRFWGQLEMDFNAVERVQEYLELPQEPPSVISSNRPPAYWPSSDRKDGFISVRDLEIKYSPELPTVFKGSFEISAGEKIGLIGRTGSGKSTLAMSLLRFTDPAAGSIWLDGIDICSIGVDDLRSRITYIPQDAVLFSGTVRDNLDPFNEHSDEELLDALARVHLGPKTPGPSVAPSRIQSSHHLAIDAEAESENDGRVSPAPSGVGKSIITLTSEVSAGGSNFSQGQRQLVAMARALLRRSNLIIMDEATASVDFATDEAIQSAIRTEFKNSTLLTIAHRLSSVIDYDRLLVLSDGKIVEFDTPMNLLIQEGSFFKSLCEKSGRYKELQRAAERKEQQDKQQKE